MLAYRRLRAAAATSTPHSMVSRFFFQNRAGSETMTTNKTTRKMNHDGVAALRRQASGIG